MQSPQSISSEVQTIPTIQGNEISFEYNLKADTALDPSLGYDANSGTLTYDMSVAPEPISFILFVTGGTLLAGRSYLRRKRT